jgi:hypothetical protein
MERFGLHKKPKAEVHPGHKAEVHPGHKLTGPKEEEDEAEAG